MAASRDTLFSSLRTLGRLRRFILPHWRSISGALLLLLGDAGMNLLKPWPLKFAFDNLVKRQVLNRATIFLLIGICAAVVVIASLEGLFVYLVTYLLNRSGRTIAFEVRNACFEHVHRLSLQFHHHKSTGDLLMRITGDVKSLRDVFTESLTEVVVNVIFLLGMFAVLVWLDWQLTLVVLAGVPFLFLALFWYTYRIKEFSRVERKREGNLAGVLHDALATIRLNRVYNREDEAREKFRAESAATVQSGFAAAMTEERFGWLVDVLGAIVIAVVLGFGVQQTMAGAMTIGTLYVFVHYVNNFFKPLRAVVKHSNRITKASIRAERIVDLLDFEEGVVDLPGATCAPRFRGAIEFRGVGFAYEPGRPALTDIQLTIKPHQLVAFVGPTGAGKTTLASLIPRLYDPTEGTLLIDGRDVREFTLCSLRAQVSVVLQESVLQRASIAENIAYGRACATREEIVAAAHAANAHEFIMALPRGYETEVGERGDTVSGGQRQRIAIARAMVRNAPILVLDEPLTGLDASAAATVMEAIDRLIRGKTAILITHDLTIVQHADLIVVFEAGRIVQRGNHRELVNAAGRYRELVLAQSRDLVVHQA
jgi:ABC-type multidrug transport system fused ATPase/permease subunit